MIKTLEELKADVAEADAAYAAANAAAYAADAAYDKLKVAKRALAELERDEAVEKLIDQQDEKSIRIRELEAKLAKLDNAAELMRLALPILKKYLQHPNDIWLVDDFRAMLGELEGGE